MEKFLSEDLGPRQFNKVKEALSKLSWESKAKIEKTNRINEKGEVEENESKLIEIFGQTSEFYGQEYQRLFNLFNGKISKASLPVFLEEADKSLKVILANPMIKDKRKTEEELRKQDQEFKERMKEQGERQAEFDRQSIEIPKGKMGILLNLCFDDSHMMTDYFCPHRNLETHLLAIVRKQSEREALARSIIEQIPDLKEIEFDWKTEKYSMGHGNYLIAKSSHETRKHKAYDGREEVNCFYEITFKSYGQEIPHEKYYLGDLTEKSGPVSNGNGKEVRENKEKNGVEIVFDSKPDDETLTLLKANGWRWSRFNGLWYNKLTPENLEFARGL
ncbi:hypothetical protein ES703_63770 [subsurface metagenome]